jgi:hypothetical protein
MDSSHGVEGMTGCMPWIGINTHTDSGGSCSQIHHCKVVCFLHLYILGREREVRPNSSRQLLWPPPPHRKLYLKAPTVPGLRLPAARGYPGTSHAAEWQDSYIRHADWRASSSSSCKTRHPLGVGRTQNLKGIINQAGASSVCGGAQAQYTNANLRCQPNGSTEIVSFYPCTQRRKTVPIISHEHWVTSTDSPPPAYSPQ